jgi:hypothetical protein
MVRSSESAANRDADEGGTEPAWAAHGKSDGGYGCPSPAR